MHYCNAIGIPLFPRFLPILRSPASHHQLLLHTRHSPLNVPDADAATSQHSERTRGLVLLPSRRVPLPIRGLVSLERTHLTSTRTRLEHAIGHATLKMRLVAHKRTSLAQKDVSRARNTKRDWERDQAHDAARSLHEGDGAGSGCGGPKPKGECSVTFASSEPHSALPLHTALHVINLNLDRAVPTPPMCVPLPLSSHMPPR